MSDANEPTKKPAHNPWVEGEPPQNLWKRSEWSIRSINARPETSKSAELRADRVIQIVEEMISGKWGPWSPRHKVKEWDITRRTVDRMISDAKNLIRLSAKVDLDYTRGALLARAEQVYHSAMSRTANQIDRDTGKRMLWSDHKGACEALKLIATLTGAAEPKRVEVHHTVAHQLEQLSSEQLEAIRSGQLTASEIKALTSGDESTIEAEFETEGTQSTE